MSILRKSVLQSFIVALLTCSIFFSSAQKPVATEYRVKAVFLFNFTQFVSWAPSSFISAQAPFVIGILGENPFDSYLEDVVSGENVNGHPLVVHHYKNIEEIKTCHILFINKAGINNPEDIPASIKGKNILTVSDAAGFLKQASVIRFITKDNKIRIQINLEAAKEAELTISSKLLRIAEIVSL
jgi:hypothetical protein